MISETQDDTSTSGLSRLSLAYFIPINKHVSEIYDQIPQNCLSVEPIRNNKEKLEFWVWGQTLQGRKVCEGDDSPFKFLFSNDPQAVG